MKINFKSSRFVLGVSVAALFAAAPASAQWVTASDAQGEYVRGRVLVMARAGLADADLGKIVGAHGGRARAIGKSRLFIVDLPPQASETAVVQQLARNPHLKFAEVDRRIRPALTPNDPYFGSQWHATKVGAPAAWDLAQGAGVKVAILDTGVDGTHPDLAAQMVPGWNFYDNNANTADVHGHGTGVAGVAAASLNNGAGVAAIAGKAWIMPIRIADPSAYATWSTVAQGITYAADQGARVANISYSNMAGSSTIQSAAQYMKNKGGLVIVAAGNNSVDEGFAQTSTLIPVSATDRNDVITSFSSYGSFVALAAPGLDITTTVRGGTYEYWWGTSVASPIVAATAALMMAANPALSSTQIESLLYSTAVDLGAAGRDKYYGWGRVNTGASVQAAAGAATPTPDTTAPTVSVASPAGSSTVSGLVAVDVNAADNVGVTKVELRVNGATVATDTASPFAFSWDSTKVVNGTTTLVAVAYDSAGNNASSSTVSINVANATTVIADTTPPLVSIANPIGGTIVKGVVSVSTSASDNSGAAGITQSLYIDGVLKATATGGSLSFNWNTRKTTAGNHAIQVVARDSAGNTATNLVRVTK